MGVKKAILEKWVVAQKKHHLSDKHVQMARELGLNPDKLGKIDNHKQETGKPRCPNSLRKSIISVSSGKRPKPSNP